ncbi:NAD(P)-dependent oxidoreductase, partial [Salmonella enterica]|nr:NAD(P)-dependent oxidoreductase [Salmonella enterica]
MKNKIIVTGHASGIGYHLANRFHDLGFSVTGIDKNISDELNCEIEQVICDLSDEDSVTRIFSGLCGYTFAVNCAGVSGV